VFAQRPHASCPGGHATHWPPEQTLPSPQRAPHAPQLDASESVSTHCCAKAKPQEVRGAGQTQVPEEQVAPEATSQPWKQAPQCAGSVSVSTHAPPGPARQKVRSPHETQVPSAQMPSVHWR
jgi:hypothetical protein